jgi:hypothetical protein
MFETIAAIHNIIQLADKMRAAYFFTPPTNAKGRRSYEKSNSHAPVTWTDEGHEYSAEFKTDCSCKNVYAKGIYTRDGKRTTLKAIKNSVARLEKERMTA